MQQPKARKVFTLASVVILATTLGACTQSIDDAEKDVLNIGFVLPFGGAYEEPATDIRDAFELYLKSNKDLLGGFEVDINLADEGAGDEAETPAASTEKLITADDADIVMGALSSPAYTGTAYAASESEVPFVGMGSIGELEEDKVDRNLLWQASYDPTDSGEAIAPYIKDNVDGPVYAVGPDYIGGYTITGSFTEPFLEMGGELANPDDEPEWTKWPDATDFSGVFERAVESDAEAIYAYYAGQPSVDFVTQWADSEASDIPLYGTYLTEGSALTDQGSAAEGVLTSQNYSPTIDNAANRKFVSEWTAAHPERLTNGYTLSGWDSALMLDQALSGIEASEGLTPEKINEAIENVGTIESPRGTWQFNSETHTPIQKWYLNTVDTDGRTLSNLTLQELATLG